MGRVKGWVASRGAGVSALAWGPLHQRGGGPVEGDLLVQQGGEHFRDRHLDAVGMRQSENRLRRLDALGGLPGGGRRLLDAQPLA